MISFAAGAFLENFHLILVYSTKDTYSHVHACRLYKVMKHPYIYIYILPLKDQRRELPWEIPLGNTLENTLGNTPRKTSGHCARHAHTRARAI